MRKFFTHIYVLNVIGYIWFLFVGKTIWKLDFAFMQYDGPSEYLELCVKVGWWFTLALGMLPAGLAVHYFEHLDQKQRKEWSYKDLIGAFLFGGVLSFGYALGGTLLFGGIGLVIGLFSEDYANAFIKLFTIMRD